MPRYIITEKNKKVIIKRERGYFTKDKLYDEGVFVIETNTKKKAQEEYKKIQNMRLQAEMAQVVTTTKDTTKTESK